VYCRQRMVNGIASSSAFRDGASMASGRKSSVIRAHACAAGAANSSAENEALGRSKGGFGCKFTRFVMAWACRSNSS